MSDFENMDVLLGSENVNHIQRELANTTTNSESICILEQNPPMKLILEMLAMGANLLGKLLLWNQDKRFQMKTS